DPAISCPTPPTDTNPCHAYYCDTTAACVVATVPDGTSCADTNLCDVDTCVSGTCTHLPSVVCNTPSLPCESTYGSCIPATGACVYPGKGQYSACNPLPSEVDPNCNATIPNNYQ